MAQLNAAIVRWVPQYIDDIFVTADEHTSQQALPRVRQRVSQLTRETRQ